MTALLVAIKELMLGPKTPNWMKLVFGLAVIACVYLGQNLAVNRLSDVQRQTATQQIVALNRAVRVIRSDVEDVREDVVEIAARDSLRARRIERLIRRVDMKVDEINANGTEGGNARIEEMERLILRRGRR